MENLQPAVNWQTPQFPPEVWELIINRMYTSEDIATILRVYPQLKSLSKSKHFHWRVSEVLWLIVSNYVNDQDTLTCRLVCKFWKRAVDRLLEDHPRRLPYNSPRLTEMTDRHFTCFKYPELRSGFNEIFKAVMCNHVIADTNGQNPFLGKYLYIYTSAFGVFANRTNVQKMRKITNFLKLLGYHVHHIVIDFFMVHEIETEEMMYLLFQCLSFLPNLRSLKIKGKFSCDKETCCKVFGNIWGKGRRIHFPAQLESLDLSAVFFDYDYLEFYTGLLNQANGNQLGKLGIDLGYWNNSLARKLPNLTDLIISHIGISRPERISPYRRLRKMFRVLPKTCKNLKKLSTAEGNVVIHTLLKVLKPCNIEMLNIQENWSSVDHATIIPTLPSIKYMKFQGDHDNMLNMDFLKAFPNLEWLKVSRPGFRIVDSNYEHEPEYGYKVSVWKLSDSIFGYLFMNRRHSGGFCIWEEFPNLKMLTLAASDEDEDYPPDWQRFVREFGSKMFGAEYVSCSYYLDGKA